MTEQPMEHIPGYTYGSTEIHSSRSRWWASEEEMACMNGAAPTFRVSLLPGFAPV